MDRISTSMLFERGTNAMLEQQAKLSKTELQLATGKRILSPKDDPAAAAYLLDLRETVSQVEQYQANSDRVRARLELQDTTLQAVTEILPRVIELTIQGQNDTNNASDREAIATELRQLNDELLALANTRDTNGEYIFAGFDADAPPFSNPAEGVYSYSGDMGVRSLQVSASRQIQDRDNGFDVFMDVEITTGANPGEKRNLFETAQLVIDGLEADAPDSSYLADLQLAHQHVLDFRVSTGARLNTLEKQESVNADFLLTIQAAQSEVEDLDYAEAVSRFQQQLLALQAAQQSFSKVQGLSLFNYL
ncbi:MAG: flagellar hook-associated protein FlgL [Gammaproteobacteria bacterium]|nr:flagellar hook-associated protein FlgL [Gammaproteobacteria bacterium]